MKYSCTVILFFSLSFFLGSCKKENQDSTKKPNKNLSLTSRTTCPTGYHKKIRFSFNDFNFHRPKFDCLRGFWACHIGGHWEVTCEPDNSVAPLSYTSGTTAYVWGKLDEVNHTVALHFPLSLSNDPNYTQEDLANLNVDDAWEFAADGDDKYTFVIGEYPVIQTSVDLTVTVPYTISQ